MSRKNSLILAAAFTGLLGGTMGRLNASPFNPNPAGAQSDTAQAPATQSCAGKNSCKGKGGWPTDGSVKNVSQKHSQEIRSSGGSAADVQRRRQSGDLVCLCM